MHTAYHPDLNEKDLKILLSEEESNHAIRVLRKSAGDSILLANGKGLKAEAKITEAHSKKCVVEIERTEFQAPDVKKVHLAIAPTKNMDRMLFLVEKATELGVNKITLLQCANSERSKIRVDKLQATALAAMKQSHRFYLPEVSELIPFKKFIEDHSSGCIAHCIDDVPKLSRRDLQDTPCIGPLLIGPEGDFRPEEVELAQSKGFISVELGKTRLRTETAGLLGVMIMRTR